MEDPSAFEDHTVGSDVPGLPDVEYATLVWVDWFNNQRLFGPLGDIPPAEHEAAYYAANQTPAA